MAVISFNPKQVNKRLLAVLSDRARDIVVSRFGLGTDTERKTLEAIGAKYKITRERVRQIENYALATIKKSDVYQKEEGTMKELREIVVSLGGIVCEEDLLNHISSNEGVQNHINFLLVLGDFFKREKEDTQFKHRWIVDDEVANRVHESLKKLYENLSDKDLIPEGEMVSSFLDYLKDISDRYKNEEVIKRWLSISKTIKRNPLGEWGVSSSPNVSARGIRDYAFLVMRRHGSPMHFTEVASGILDIFGKKAHTATCHNELIKDERFVLVGRGLYALKEWGYEKGVVRDVIKNILKEDGPLTKEEIVAKVLNERHVKENTILVNLQNPSYFKRDTKGRYVATF
ncbi:MAG: hypothetical protein A2591_02085 [Candidatus Yonathbacteria bacterium RIFOXYD1_FULL_52_36]|uniref:RNA polymerase sigma-70 region 4 domain-containing protein n=1 Tax=Candidatus Yonathbacteria bacterium RIFOXYD1_FULL_52_36 TaxID=1802730 RepID=A0A1G2SKH1_9BACT|nr:MAG: hypothetical protein A2591_02085 [Candidatus Yonathbacteria bacterium RIFOXYD1_FULL_52_36]